MSLQLVLGQILTGEVAMRDLMGEDFLSEFTDLSALRFLDIALTVPQCRCGRIALECRFGAGTGKALHQGFESGMVTQ